MKSLQELVIRELGIWKQWTKLHTDLTEALKKAYYSYWWYSKIELKEPDRSVTKVGYEMVVSAFGYTEYTFVKFNVENAKKLPEGPLTFTMYDLIENQHLLTNVLKTGFFAVYYKAFTALKDSKPVVATLETIKKGCYECSESMDFPNAEQCFVKPDIACLFLEAVCETIKACEAPSRWFQTQIDNYDNY